MNRKLATTAAGRGDWFDRTDALAAGYNDNQIRGRVRTGQWIRLCHGAYAEPRADHESLPEWARARWLHLRTARAIYCRLGGRAVVSHQSALVLHGIEVTDLDLGRVHVTRLVGLGRSGPAVCQHAARPPVLESVELSGVLLSPGARAVVEAIRFTPYPVGVSVVDEALRTGVASASDLATALEPFANRTGIGTATRAVTFGDGGSESVGESRLRVLMADLGLPPPVLQAEIRDALGQLLGRVDFLLAEWGVIVDFDGALKYAGQSAAPLVREKRRGCPPRPRLRGDPLDLGGPGQPRCFGSANRRGQAARGGPAYANGGICHRRQDVEPPVVLRGASQSSIRARRGSRSGSGT